MFDNHPIKSSDCDNLMTEVVQQNCIFTIKKARASIMPGLSSELNKLYVQKVDFLNYLLEEESHHSLHILQYLLRFLIGS